MVDKLMLALARGLAVNLEFTGAVPVGCHFSISFLLLTK